jgi:ankyrin repeat protein
MQLLNNPTPENFTKIITILYTIPDDKKMMLINLQNDDGDTIFHIACRQKDIRIRRLYDLCHEQGQCTDIINNAGEIADCNFLTSLGGNKKTKTKKNKTKKTKTKKIKRKLTNKNKN